MRRCWPSSSQALREAGLEQFQLRIGDLGLFSALLEALPMPRRWRRRLRHHFWRPEAFRAELARLTSAAALKQLGVPRELIERLDPGHAGGGPGLRRGVPRPVRAGADRHAHAARDRRAPAGRGRRCARDAAGAADGGADRELRRASRPRRARPAGRIEALQRAAQDRPRTRARRVPAPPRICSRRPASTPPGRRSPPSSGATSSTTPASCSRSSCPSSGPRARSPAAAATTACSPTSAPRPPCRRSARRIHTERLLAVLSGAAP